MTIPLLINGRSVDLHAAINEPAFGTRTVLTNEPWTYISLWLKRNGKDDALFYWQQAKQFYDSSIDLNLEAAPLSLYYSYMNATKALLAANNIQFVERHGVRRAVKPNASLDIDIEAVEIQDSGILPSLSDYYGESEVSNIHSLQELFFNMAFIHRTYCLTFESQQEMFVSLKDCGFVFDEASNEVCFQGWLAKNSTRSDVENATPTSLVASVENSGLRFQSRQRVPWANPNSASATELSELAALHRALRLDLHYIKGSAALWYLRLTTNGPHVLRRRSPTMTLAAMHRLSEICRYRPKELARFLNGGRNWLISEFVAMSPSQFFDEIAAELTGFQFLAPNVRAPS